MGTVSRRLPFIIQVFFLLFIVGPKMLCPALFSIYLLCITPVFGIFKYPWHASCRLQWTFSSLSCSQVGEKLERQMESWEGDSNCGQTSSACPELPCGQLCLYTLVNSSPSSITAEHRTPVARYVDDLTFTLTESSTGGGCQVEAFSTSRLWYALLDKGTNYCNLRNLIDGAGLSSGCGFSEVTSNKKCTQYDVKACSRFYHNFCMLMTN